MNRLAVFDLDGTLLDTAPDIRVAANRQLALHGLAPLTLAEVTPMIGDGARVLCERAFAARGRQGVNYARNCWHHPLLVLDPDSRFIIVDRGGAGHNLDEVWLDAGEQLELAP